MSCVLTNTIILRALVTFSTNNKEIGLLGDSATMAVCGQRWLSYDFKTDRLIMIGNFLYREGARAKHRKFYRSSK